MQYRKFDGASGRIRYLDLGSGPNLLFLHGVGLQASTYAPLLNALARSFRVVAPDIPGFGGSFTPPGSWTAGDLAGAVSGLATHLALSEFHVVGHSLGGAVAIELAARDPAARRLVLVNALAVPPPWSTAGLLFRFFILKNLGHAARPGLWLPLARSATHFVANLLRGPKRAPRMFRITLREVFREDRPFPRIRHPATLLWADPDPVFPLRTTETLTAKLPGARVVVASGSHDWCVLRGAEAAARIVEAIGGP